MPFYHDTPPWLAEAGPHVGSAAAELVLDDAPLDPAFVVDTLADYLTDARRARIEAVLDARTYGLVPVVEGVVNSGNVRAVMRTAEGLGCQAFHAIEGAAQFKDSGRTSKGAEKWLDVHLWPTPDACADYLQASGYQLVATHLDATAVPIGEIDFRQKTALLFGNEQDGLSPALLARSDRRCIIPIDGFVQSFNISVAAALGLYHAQQARRRHLGRTGDLTDAERQVLRAAFYRRAYRNADAILQRARTDATS